MASTAPIPDEHPASAALAADFAMSDPDLLPYDEQRLMATMMHDTTLRGGGAVGLIEAPTATGKTLVMAQHALAHVARTGSPIVIAAPSVELCHQTADAIERLRLPNPAYAGIRVSVTLGRQEYMSPDGAEALAAAEDEGGNEAGARTIRAWIEAGAPGVDDRSPRYTKRGLERALDDAGVRVRAIPDWATLAHFGTDDPAQAEYAAGFLQADIVIVTHAMLARDIIKRYLRASAMRRDAGIRTRHRGDGWWIEAARERLQFEAAAEGRLPDYRHLVVDEAHLLHENVAAAMTTTFSVRQAIANVSDVQQSHPRSVPAWVLPRLGEIRQALSDHALSGGGERIQINWTADRGFGDILTELRGALDAVKEPKGGGGGGAMGEIKRARMALRQSLDARGAMATTIEWSPRHTYPSVGVGPHGIRAEMHFLWGRLESACLVSATLYAENRDGPSAKWITEPLGVGPDAVEAWPPIRAAWTTQGVTVLSATGQSATDLTPPPHGQPDGAWIDALAEAVDAVQAQEPGKGVLVLTTTRSVTQRLCRALEARGVDGGRIIDGTANRMGANRIRFERDARNGLRPVWIAQGPAWTGLDLADDTLGALAITRLPFPPPRPGSTAGAPAVYDGAKANDMLMRLKQGLGRLVRTRHPSPKRAYVLDGRLEGGTVAAAANTMLDRYRRERF